LPTTLEVKNLIITSLEPSFSAPTHQPWYIMDYIMDQHYHVLMEAIELQGTISPQSKGEEVKRQMTLDRFKPALIVLFEREYVIRSFLKRGI
jgi:hypothetical protein